MSVTRDCRPTPSVLRAPSPIHPRQCLRNATSFVFSSWELSRDDGHSITLLGHPRPKPGHAGWTLPASKAETGIPRLAISNTLEGCTGLLAAPSRRATAYKAYFPTQRPLPRLRRMWNYRW